MRTTGAPAHAACSASTVSPETANDETIKGWQRNTGTETDNRLLNVAGGNIMT